MILSSSTGKCSLIIFYWNLSGNAGKAKGIAAALDSENFWRERAVQWNLLSVVDKKSLASRGLLFSTVFVGVLFSTFRR